MAVNNIKEIKKAANEAVEKTTKEMCRNAYDQFLEEALNKPVESENDSDSTKNGGDKPTTYEYVDDVVNNLIHYVDDSDEELSDELDDLFDEMDERISSVERKIGFLKKVGTFIFSAGVMVGFLITFINTHFGKKDE